MERKPTVVAVIAGAIAAGVVLFGLPSTESAFERSCSEGNQLIRARLLDEARGLFLRLDAERGPDPCAADRLRGVDYEQHTSGVLLERARTYRSVVAVRGGKRDRVRRTALRRARRSYIAALQYDPFPAGARRELRGVVIAMGPPATAAEAYGRCRLGRDLRNAGLLSEARLVYTQALASGRSNNCVRFALRRTRWQRARAFRRARVGRALEAAGEKRKAWAAYVAALTADPTVPGARRAIDRLPTTNPNLPLWVSGAFAWASDEVEEMTHFADEWTQKAAGVALTVLLLLLAVLGLAWALYFACRWRRLRRFLGRWAPFRRVALTRAHVRDFLPAEDPTSDAQAHFDFVLAQRPLGEDPPPPVPSRSDPAPVDVVSAEVQTSTATFDLSGLAALPQVAGIAALGVLLSRALPRREVYIMGRFLPADRLGVGLRLQLADRRGRVYDVRERWAAQLEGGDPGAPRAHHALAIEGAEWVRGRVA